MNSNSSRTCIPRFALLLPALLLGGCGGNPPTAEEAFENLQIQVQALQGREVQLTERRADFPDEGIAVVLDDLHLIGELDGSGRRYASGIVYTEREGAPGTSELVVAVEAVGNMRYLASHALGKAYRLEGIRYAGGEVVLHLLDHAPEDAPCCPTISLERRFHLMGGGLMESGPAMMGPAPSASDSATAVPTAPPASAGGTP